MRLLTSLILFLLLCSSNAFAELSDDDYVTTYFGTKALLQTAEQVYNPEEMGWWTDMLPTQLTYDGAYLSGIVNAGRIARGETVLLDPNEYSVMPGTETYKGTYYEYDINFMGMRPSEVEIIFASLGGLEAVMPGATLEFAPVVTRDYYYYSQDSSSDLIVQVGEESLAVNFDLSAPMVHEKLLSMFRNAYGRDVNIDLYYNQQISSYRTGVDITLTVTLLDDAGSAMASE